MRLWSSAIVRLAKAAWFAADGGLPLSPVTAQVGCDDGVAFRRQRLCPTPHDMRRRIAVQQHGPAGASENEVDRRFGRVDKAALESLELR